MAQMDDDTLLAQLETLERQAVGYFNGEIAGAQSKAMDYYLGKPFGTEEIGQSAVVSTDVWDVVEGLTPLVLKPFVSSDDVVRFNPVGPEDEEAAQQESDYVNYIVTQKGDIFNELVAAVKTGLLQKNAVAMYWWEKSRRVEIERYSGITDDQYALMLQDGGVEVAQHTEYQSQMPDGTPVTLHDCVVRVVNEVGQAKYQVIPPEEVRISRDAMNANPKDCRYIAQVTKKTISEIREMGYDVPDDVQDYNGQDPYLSPQYLARRQAEETQLYGLSSTLDPAGREVMFTHALVRIDYDGDGIAELRRVIRVGREILLNEEAEEVNFVSWTPYPQPFKFYGRCPADETLEIQLVKSTLWRQALNNIYTINNNRNFVSDAVNLDDLLDNQIGGIVRVKGGGPVGGHVMPAPVTPIGQIIQPLIEYADAAKENRTGFTRYNQGMDANSLNKTATGVRLISDAGNQRIELISRAFAEQFLKPLMLGIHGLLRRHATQAETYRLRGKWVNIDPREWKTRYDMSISVGLGNADKQLQLTAHQMLLQEQKQLAAIPGLVSPENLFNGAAKLAEIVGEKSPEKYFSDPSKTPPPQPPDPMENPEFMLKVAESRRADREIDIRKQEADIKERDSVIAGLVAAGNMEANIAKVMAEPGLMAYLQKIQMQLAQLQTQATQDVATDPDDDANMPSVPALPPMSPENQIGQAGSVGNPG